MGLRKGVIKFWSPRRFHCHELVGLCSFFRAPSYSLLETPRAESPGFLVVSPRPHLSSQWTHRVIPSEQE